jgi:3-dehydroquinate synthase
MGGFIASTYKRGIDYINVPTTLLSMVDASVGGKTGIDFGTLKNQIGTFYDPKMVVIDNEFLNTLEKNEISSGYAEIFKHSLIHDLPTYNLLISNDTPFYDLKTIYNSIITKNKIVLIDKKEQKERKSLNYGHTLGHAIESYFLNSEHKLLHGEAVSIGIVLASFLSYKLFNFSIDHVNSIKKHINCIYKKIEISESQIGSIIDLLIHDKKNSHGKINFILLKEIAEPVYDIQVKKELIKESFKYYLS